MNNIYLSNSIKFLISSISKIFIISFLFLFKIHCILSILLYIIIDYNIKISSILSVISTYLNIYLRFNKININFDKESLNFYNNIKNRKIYNYDKIIVYSEFKAINDFIPIIKFFNNNLFFINFLNNINCNAFKKKILEKINEISRNESNFIKNNSMQVFIIEDVRLIEKKIFNKNEYVFIIIKDIMESKIPSYLINHITSTL